MTSSDNLVAREKNIIGVTASQMKWFITTIWAERIKVCFLLENIVNNRSLGGFLPVEGIAYCGQNYKRSDFSGKMTNMVNIGPITSRVWSEMQSLSAWISEKINISESNKCR